MKKWMLWVLLVLGISLAACLPPFEGGEAIALTGSGTLVTRELDEGGFDRISAGSVADLEIRYGDDYSVIVRVDDNAEQYLHLRVRGTTLEIDLRADSGLSLRSVTLEAEVTMPRLERLDLDGASNAVVEGFADLPAFRAEISGGSSLWGDLSADRLDLHVSGAGDAALFGSGQELEVECSGAGRVDMLEFPVTDAIVDASGASTVMVNVEGQLDADASGSSRIWYTGDPELRRVQTSGSASIRER